MADATNNGDSPRLNQVAISNWSIAGLLVTFGPLILNELRARETKQEELWKEAQARTELVVKDQTEAYQKSIADLVEQWKEDRRMLIDVLKDGRLDQPSPSMRESGSSVLQPQPAELVKGAVKQWQEEFQKVH